MLPARGRRRHRGRDLVRRLRSPAPRRPAVARRGGGDSAPHVLGNPRGVVFDAVRHKVIDIGGPVHYLDFGGEGDPVVMVHGLGGNALNWMDVGPGLAEAHRAVALDLAGFGRTPLFNRSATVGANAELVTKFI